MKTIVYRGGVVTFRIPAHWREEYSDFEGGMFYDNRLGSGTLRLTITTISSPKRLGPVSAPEVLQVVVNGLRANGVDGAIQSRSDGNATLKYEQLVTERGAPLTIFYWVIANPLPPRHARIATFSYTIHANQRSQSRVLRDIEMTEAEIEAATFSPVLGVVSG